MNFCTVSVLRIVTFLNSDIGKYVIFKKFNEKRKTLINECFIDF